MRLCYCTIAEYTYIEITGSKAKQEQGFSWSENWHRCCRRSLSLSLHEALRAENPWTTGVVLLVLVAVLIKDAAVPLVRDKSVV